MNKAPLLIVGPSWVGDMVMAQSLFRLLHESRPHVPIDVIAPRWSLPVLARMPEVRRGIALPVAHRELGLGKRWQLARQLRATGYTGAIVLPRSLKAALVPWLAGIPERTGFRGEMRYGVINDMRTLDGDLLDQTVKRFIALGLRRGDALPDIPEPRLEISSENQQRLISDLRLAIDKPVIALLPGAEYGPAKCWPLAYFRELAGLLQEAGLAVWIMGSAADRPAGEYIAHGTARNLCGSTELADAIDLLAYCEQAVSNDSGLLHVAAATGTHVNALYGSSSPTYTPPLTTRRRIHYLDIECSPCFERQCPLEHLRCLRDIRPQAVLAGIKSQLS